MMSRQLHTQSWTVRRAALLLVIMALLLILIACAAPAAEPQVVTRVVEVETEVTRIVEGEPVVETITEQVEVTRIVEAEPEPEPAEDKYGGTLTVGYSMDITSFDPPKAVSTMDWGSTFLLLYNRLYSFDENNEIVPDLATEMPEISEDGLVYTVHLKEGVLFHNGRELIADDVKYSMERNAHPDAASWNATAPLINIVGGQAVIDGTAETAEGIRAVDDYTIEFTLVEPDAYFVHGLTLTTNAVVPREAVEEFGEDFSFNPVGTGPFTLTEWVPGERVVFERFEDYFVEGLPYLDSVVYELGAAPEVSMLRFESGEIDVVADGVPSGDIARAATDAVLREQFLSTQSWLTVFVGFNTETPPFDNPDVRKAIAMAIDRERLIQLSSLTSSISYNWYPPSHYQCSAGAENIPYPYDPEAAQALLTEAGYPDGIDVQGWFRVVRPWLNRIPEAVQQDLAAIGVRVELLQLESAVATEMLNNGELPIFMQAWGASFPDPFNFATELFQTGSTYSNRWSYSNPDVDALIAGARQDIDEASRCEQWLEMQELVMADLPAIPLFVAGYPDMQSSRIQDFVYNHVYHRPWYDRVWIAAEDR